MHDKLINELKKLKQLFRCLRWFSAKFWQRTGVGWEAHHQVADRAVRAWESDVEGKLHQVDKGAKKKHIEPYQTEWSCYKLFAYMFDIVWLCLQVANRNRWAFFHAFNFRERRVLTATDAKGKFALTNLLIYANYHKSGRTNARKLPFFFASFLRRMS